MRKLSSCWQIVALVTAVGASFAACGGGSDDTGSNPSGSGPAGSTNAAGGNTNGGSGGGTSTGAAGSTARAGSGGTTGGGGRTAGGGGASVADGGPAFDLDAYIASKTCGSAVCDAWHVCDTTSNTCVGCLDNSNCFGGMTCSSKKECVNACSAEADCTGDGGQTYTPHCDVSNQKCVGCRNNDDCTTGTRNRCGSASYCVECESDTDCTAPATCFFGGCFTAPTFDGGGPPVGQDASTSTGAGGAKGSGGGSAVDASATHDSSTSD